MPEVRHFPGISDVAVKSMKGISLLHEIPNLISQFKDDIKINNNIIAMNKRRIDKITKKLADIKEDEADEITDLEEYITELRGKNMAYRKVIKRLKRCMQK